MSTTETMKLVEAVRGSRLAVVWHEIHLAMLNERLPEPSAPARSADSVDMPQAECPAPGKPENVSS